MSRVMQFFSSFSHNSESPLIFVPFNSLFSVYHSPYSPFFRIPNSIWPHYWLLFPHLGYLWGNIIPRFCPLCPGNHASIRNTPIYAEAFVIP
jgi:hypothetical protein